MPSNESYRSYLDTPSERWKAVPKAVRMLYRNEQSFRLYQDFKHAYSGNTFGQNHPVILRDRGGYSITYDMPVISAITTDGNHLIHIAAGHNQERTALDPRLQFFVVTADFKTGDTTEWWLYNVRANSFGEPNRLELFMASQPIHEAPEYVAPYQETLHPFDELDRIEDAEQHRRDLDARAIRYVYEHQRSYLSWGDGKAPSTFRSFSEIEADLYLLHQAEITGQLGPAPVGHQHVIEHLRRAA